MLEHLTWRSMSPHSSFLSQRVLEAIPISSATVPSLGAIHAVRSILFHSLGSLVAIGTDQHAKLMRITEGEIQSFISSRFTLSSPSWQMAIM